MFTRLISRSHQGVLPTLGRVGRPALLLPRPVAVGVNSMFSRNMTTESKEPEKQKIDMNYLRKIAPQIGLIGGGILVIYGISSLAVNLMTMFFRLDFETVFYAGFGTGVLTTGLLASVLVHRYRSQRLRPANVFQVALKALQENPNIHKHFGLSLRVTPLRSYLSEPGYFSPTSFKWINPRMQMLFKVSGAGNQRDAYVTVQALKKFDDVKLTFLAYDLMPYPGSDEKPETVVLVGSPKKLNEKDNIRNFVQGERVKYFEPKFTVQDEDKIKEQNSI